MGKKAGARQEKVDKVQGFLGEQFFSTFEGERIWIQQ
jgi:hypothetical protein